MMTRPRTQERASSRDLTRIFEDNEIRDAYRISFIANSIVMPLYESIRRDFGLTRGEYLLLFCLAHCTELTAQDVANMTGRPRNSISRGVHRMLAEGFISRVPDHLDGRQSLLRITRKGRDLQDKILERFKAREDATFDVLSQSERRTLDRLLRKLVLHVAEG